MCDRTTTVVLAVVGVILSAAGTFALFIAYAVVAKARNILARSQTALAHAKAAQEFGRQ